MHTVVAVRYKKDKVVAVCSCEWESSERSSETEARAEHEKHAKKAAA